MIYHTFWPWVLGWVSVSLCDFNFSIEDVYKILAEKTERNESSVW
jgi:hypothetical protein